MSLCYYCSGLYFLGYQIRPSCPVLKRTTYLQQNQGYRHKWLVKHHLIRLQLLIAIQELPLTFLIGVHYRQETDHSPSSPAIYHRPCSLAVTLLTMRDAHVLFVTGCVLDQAPYRLVGLSHAGLRFLLLHHLAVRLFLRLALRLRQAALLAETFHHCCHRRVIADFRLLSVEYALISGFVLVLNVGYAIVLLQLFGEVLQHAD